MGNTINESEASVLELLLTEFEASLWEEL